MQPPTYNNDPEMLLAQGIAALKAGDRAGARDLLAQAIRLNPTDERSWLWLSGAVETDDERRRCLERVLQINPQHAAARRGLAALAAANAPVAVAPQPPTSAYSGSGSGKPSSAQPCSRWAITDSTTFTRANRLSSASTSTHGASGMSVSRSMSSIAAR